MTKINIDNLRNPLEAQTYKTLKASVKNGGYSIVYEEEVLQYVLEKTYIPDFILQFPSGRKRYIEVKGFLRRDDMRKMVAVRKQNPDLDIRIFFAKDNKVSKNSRMRYSDWAIKNGFDYAVGYIPEEWLVE